MKILFYSYAYPNVCDAGLATFNRTMIAGLAREHDVRVVSPVPFAQAVRTWLQGKSSRGLNDPTFQAVPGVPAVYCPWYYTPKLFRNQYGRFMEWSVRRVLDRALREFQPDVVLSYWTHPDGEVAVKAAHRFGIRAVTMVGGSDILLNARRGSRRQASLNVLKSADAVITVSDAIRQVLIEDGIAEHKLHVVRRGIDPEVFHRGLRKIARNKLGLPDDRPILVNVGRLVDVKGHQHLIQACRLLVARGLNFHCSILGDGPLRASLQQQIEQSGLSQHVELKGPKTSTQLGDWYRAADLSVLASLSEGIPNVLLESMACGTPFVASKVGGIPEIADPYQDRLVPPANPAALADAIAQQLSRPDKIARKPRRFEPLTMAQSAAKLSEILEFVSAGRPIKPIISHDLHETMSGHAMFDHQISQIVTNRPRQRTFTHLIPVDNDPLGMTGEELQYFA